MSKRRTTKVKGNHSLRTDQTRDRFSAVASRSRLRFGFDFVKQYQHDIWSDNYGKRYFQVQDARRHHGPIRHQQTMRVDGAPARVNVVSVYNRVRPIVSLFSQPSRSVFCDPKKVITCRRRKARKEILHALGLTGRGFGARRGARWTADSYISCGG